MVYFEHFLCSGIDLRMNLSKMRKTVLTTPEYANSLVFNQFLVRLFFIALELVRKTQFIIRSFNMRSSKYTRDWKLSFPQMIKYCAKNFTFSTKPNDLISYFLLPN